MELCFRWFKTCSCFFRRRNSINITSPSNSDKPKIKEFFCGLAEIKDDSFKTVGFFVGKSNLKYTCTYPILIKKLYFYSITLLMERG